MQFFIKVLDGQPDSYPTDLDSLRTLGNGFVPVGYEPFEPLQPPSDLGPYEVTHKNPVFIRNGDVWTHDWGRRSMTAEEKAAHIAAIQEQWQANGYPSWIWHEDECRYTPPVQPPTDGLYHWDEVSQQWNEGSAPKF